jgi:hypothetical protein
MAGIKNKKVKVVQKTVTKSVDKKTSKVAATKQPLTVADAPKKVSAADNEDLDPHTRRILKIRDLMKLRDEARTNGDFAKSDSLRHHMVEKYNIDIVDQKNGPSGWKFQDGSSNKIRPGTKMPQEDITDGSNKPALKKRTNDDNDSTNKSKPDNKKKVKTPDSAPSSANNKQKGIDIGSYLMMKILLTDGLLSLCL